LVYVTDLEDVGLGGGVGRNVVELESVVEGDEAEGGLIRVGDEVEALLDGGHSEVEEPIDDGCGTDVDAEHQTGHHWVLANLAWVSHSVVKSELEGPTPVLGVRVPVHSFVLVVDGCEVLCQHWVHGLAQITLSQLTTIAELGLAVHVGLALRAPEWRQLLRLLY
jgi:hypothetical protein